MGGWVVGMDGWTARWTGGQKDRWTDRWMGGWKKASIVLIEIHFSNS